MSKYLVTPRKFRPKKFSEVLGQGSIVTTLRNAIKHDRLAQAYLFCGSRGTGKTTLARILAMALNCENPSDECEPCGTCTACHEIAGGHSMDVLEIDGASHRGIDDIRQINETVGYASAGNYKIYLIDEVHMLTKEAFNALLKTLEEPPPQVKFFFATTEPHKVLPTILSRCQRFNLNRIPVEVIIEKLTFILKDLGVEAEEPALRLIANRADGGLRDAESLLDQILAFHEGTLTADSVAANLGLVSRDCLFELDKAGKEGDLSVAFDIAHRIFAEGKDLIHFIETMTEHFRNLLVVKVAGEQAPYLSISEEDRADYAASAKLYRRDQLLVILDSLIEAQTQIRFMPSSRIALEAILLQIMRSHHRLPVEYLVQRLTELEQTALERSAKTPQGVDEKPKQIVSPPPVAPVKVPEPVAAKQSETVPPVPVVKEKAPEPTPSPEKPVQPIDQAAMGRYDTLMQFAAVELEGNLQKHIHQG